MYSLHKICLMEFILTTDKKENRDDFGKNEHDLVQEYHNMVKTTFQQHNNLEQYQFGIRCNP